MITLLKDETIVLKRRRHWFVIVSEGALLLLVALALPLTLLVAGSSIPVVGEFLSRYFGFAVFLTAVWWQIMWIIFFIAWTNYYLDVLLITNKRIMDIEQLGLFSRDFVELRLENVQDVKVEVLGLIPSLLKMGNLHIQNAGQSKEVVIRNIPEPHQVRKIISQYHDLALSGGSLPRLGEDGLPHEKEAP